MKNYSLLLALIAIIGFSSCQSLRIEKRQYTGGWYVDFSNNKKAEGQTAKTDREEPVATVAVAEQQPEAEVTSPWNWTTNDNGSNQQMATTTGANYTVISPASPTESSESVAPETINNPERVKKEREQTNAPEAGGDTNLILLFILALLLPPLAVYLKQGLTTIFWIDLILAILGSGFLFYTYIGGFFLVAVVIAILVVFDVM